MLGSGVTELLPDESCGLKNVEPVEQDIKTFEVLVSGYEIFQHS